MGDAPQRYDPKEAEPRWRDAWEKSGLYKSSFRDRREENFTVDTPPPTVSGSLHMGHIFSYTHPDVLVRYRRMRGQGIFYPMGWDDNGLPTERRVQNVFNVGCDPKLPYEPGLRVERGAKERRLVSRRNFIELCQEVTAEDEKAFQDLWKRIGLSVDWTEEYATINAHCRRLSQWSFLDLFRKGHVYSEESPHFWDVTFQTAVAQAEIEDRPVGSAYHTLRFAVEGGGELAIATTRPELLGGCVAMAVHPDDARHRAFVGRSAITPLYRVRVPIVASDTVDREKGTGALMICTFGDQMDVQWWREFRLPLRQVIGRNGRIDTVRYGAPGWESLDPEGANRFHAELAGKSPEQARKRVAELLALPESSASGDGRPALAKPPEPITHPVKFYEKGDRPLELLTTRQWFVRILDKKEALIGRGRQIAWHPDFMRKRYENWVEGLNTDWCISRQRYFGVPIPVWYEADGRGAPRFDRPILPDEKALPVDPLSDIPPGSGADRRDAPGGFVADPDVFDTWFTSSLTPQIGTRWHGDPARHGKLFPMDIRPQAHEIIRTWAFYTILKAHLHDGDIPWKNVVISGWILDPDRKKMSKSKGNVVTPMGLIEQHSADAVRYWAARARLGVDTIFDEKVLQIGGKLTNKLFNACRFLQGHLDGAPKPLPGPAAIGHPLDRMLAARLARTVQRATDEFERSEFAAALAATEEFFWADFCDNYLELAKHRLYGQDRGDAYRSALATLDLALSVQLRLFAPFVPFITEEMWRQFKGSGTETPSVHISPWPAAAEWKDVQLPSDLAAYDALIAALTQIRKGRTEAVKQGIKAAIAEVQIAAPQADADRLRPFLSDLKGYTGASEIDLRAAEGGAPLAAEVRMATT